jgi:hypothetical protein
MAYTFLDQQNFLSSLVGDPNTTTDDQWPLAQRKTELNNGELQFARDAKNLREYSTATISGSQIAMPSDWLGTYVLIIDDKTITNDREIAIQDWERYYNYTGTPPYYYYWEFSGTRYIKIIGSGTTYKLYYWKRPTTALSGDSDVSLHPEEYRKAPVYFAAAELLKQIGKHQEASLMSQYYQEYVIRANTDISKSFISKEYARPDLGDTSTSSTDVQGGGVQWRW